MGMVGNEGVVCRCLLERTRLFSYTFREAPSADKLRFRRHLLNVPSKSFFGAGAATWRSVAGNSCIFSIDSREKARSAILQSPKHKRVPVFVMMPMDSFGIDTTGAPRIRKVKALAVSLKALKLAGVHGIAVEVWWGIVERLSPLAYNWSLYEDLFKLIAKSGLKLHVALSFHSNMHQLSGGKGGVSLPLWIQEIGDLNKDIYYRDRNGFSNDDYLTLGVDQLPLFCGRTALQCYEDFMFSFVNNFRCFFGSVIEEISVGLGPSGELRYEYIFKTKTKQLRPARLLMKYSRYPSHPFADGRWRFPGIGEFQCYDKYMMADLKMAASQEGKPQWGDRGPHNAGCYNSLPSGVPFFEGGQEGFLSDFGRFFLEWYSDRLIHHADAILAKAVNMLQEFQESEQTSVMLAAKIGGIYWWYHTASHSAELTAGYYNTAFRNGYDLLALMLSHHGAALHIPCLEMMDREMPPTYLCSPEGLLQQIRTVSENRIIQLIGSNTNERLDKAGLHQIYSNCYHPEAEAVRSFTYFRMNDKFFRVDNWNNFVPFVRKMSPDL